jgi:hypothetical protein
MTNRLANPFASVPPPVRLIALLGAVALVPLCFLGAGTDLDAGSVLLSGDRIVHGHYVASRAPGAPLHEALAGVLDLLGGIWAVNLLSLVAAVVVCAGVWWLLDREGVRAPWLGAAFVAASPWFQIAATSTVDFVLVTALVVGSAVALRRGSWLVAGVLGGLAIGTRMSTVLLVFAMAVAEVTDRPRRIDRAVRLLVTAAVVSVLAFVPPFLAAGESLAFAQNDFATSTPVNHLGRAFVKNVAYLGPYAAVVLLLSIPALWALRRDWTTRWNVRFAVTGFLLSELLFVRFPWKVGHLIPGMVCLAVLMAEALRDRRRLLVALVAAQAALGVVNVELFKPDVPNAAGGAELHVRVRPGPLVVDTQCRLDDRGAARSLDIPRMEALWNCARPFGTGPGADTDAMATAAGAAGPHAAPATGGAVSR